MKTLIAPETAIIPAGLRGGPLHIGSLEVPTRFFLAPLAGYTTLAFRLAVRQLGGLGLATTDLVNPRALLRESRKSLELIQTCPADRPLAVQIYGSEAAEMRAAAQWLEAHGTSVVDINMGCPVHKVCRHGGGSALMCDPAATVALVRGIVEAVRIPVTVKMRLGLDDSDWSAPWFARAFEQAGVAAVTIHGRTRQQGFTGTVKLDGIRAVVEAVERIPVIGNGDVRTLADAAAMMRATGCAGVAIGRGALLHPWLFAEIQSVLTTGTMPPAPGRADRLAFMARHFRALVEHRGERSACLIFRKVANWYCRVLHPGRAIQQRLVRLESAAEFEFLLERMREQLPTGEDTAPDVGSPVVAVPQGPVEYW
jgi:nifR3 family TIM-barrel protein